MEEEVVIPKELMDRRLTAILKHLMKLHRENVEETLNRIREEGKYVELPRLTHLITILYEAYVDSDRDELSIVAITPVAIEKDTGKLILRATKVNEEGKAYTKLFERKHIYIPTVKNAVAKSKEEINSKFVLTTPKSIYEKAWKKKIDLSIYATNTTTIIVKSMDDKIILTAILEIVDRDNELILIKSMEGEEEIVRMTIDDFEEWIEENMDESDGNNVKHLYL